MAEFIRLYDVHKRYYSMGMMDQADLIYQLMEESPLLTALSFMNNAGSYKEVNRITGHSSTEPRRINQGYSGSGYTSGVDQFLKSILGGIVQVDKALLNRYGNDEIERQRREKIRVMRATFERLFVKGDSETNDAEFNGLQKLLTGSAGKQIINAGSTSGGDALDLGKLDQAYLAVYNPTHWIMNTTMYRRLDKITRQSNSMNYVPNELGIKQQTYKGLPIIHLREDAQGNEILPFTEANPGGGTPASTSIYCVSLSEMGLYGIQTQDISIEFNGEQVVSDGTGKLLTANVTQIEWDAGIAYDQQQSICRVQGIKDAAITDS
jgi:hypothetical protein